MTDNNHNYKIKQNKNPGKFFWSEETCSDHFMSAALSASELLYYIIFYKQRFVSTHPPCCLTFS